MICNKLAYVNRHHDDLHVDETTLETFILSCQERPATDDRSTRAWVREREDEEKKGDRRAKARERGVL